jgi:CheY-like chemotaxis protein
MPPKELRMSSDAKILVIEDDPDTQFVTSFVLRNAGYLVVSVANRDGALALVKEYRPELIVMDYRMEGMGFDEFISATKALAANVHFVLLSANAKQVARRYGIRYSMEKPFDIDELQKVVADCLRGGSSALLAAVKDA